MRNLTREETERMKTFEAQRDGVKILFKIVCTREDTIRKLNYYIASLGAKYNIPLSKEAEGLVPPSDNENTIRDLQIKLTSAAFREAELTKLLAKLVEENDELRKQK